MSKEKETKTKIKKIEPERLKSITIDLRISKYPGPEGQALGYPWKGMFYC